jgi:hypothetical protein
MVVKHQHQIDWDSHATSAQLGRQAHHYNNFASEFDIQVVPLLVTQSQMQIRDLVTIFLRSSSWFLAKQNRRIRV